MALARVSKPCVVTVDGVPTALSVGQEFDSDDPVVVEFPWAFTDVEEATAVPGRKRNVRR